ncbi:transcription termination/antitermination protein NusG [Thermorudis peleae]|uniref:transcription termination/antitermination protein NusG n=1 Tax=Thermorudis peleae TaxID=1382356 RepID=UPI00056E17EE|nr:transcription termination/antitermination protein NusG [Thermorudis peleae]MBX6754787.1 transcription termination/antitermination protein NusG [Thermorudis peleae]
MPRTLRERLLQKRAESAGEQPGKWYVIHTYSGYENKVRQNLLHRIETMDVADKVFDVVVPVQEEVEIRGGQRQTVERKVFPGYVLVRMILDDESWHVVRNTPGVTGFVGVGNRPVPLDDAEAQAILSGTKTEAPKVKVTLMPGDPVRIIDGPFTDFRGVVDEVDYEKGKVRVLVSFFGRETPVTLDFLQVERET